jgi:DNA-binding NarL/FixJ family response regulator
VVVAHREALAGEGIAAALGRYPALVPVGVASSSAQTELLAGRADAVAIDGRLPGASRAVARMLKRGLRVVVIDDQPSGEDDGGGIVVAVHAQVAQLARALEPGIRPHADPSSALSTREEQVLRLASKGLVGKQIARALDISPKTVEQHKTHAYRRLGVPNLAAAVALLMERGGAPWTNASAT